MFIVLLLIMQKSKKIILFDIDNTLFNTLKFKQTNFQLFSLYEEVYETLEQLKEIADLGIFSEGEIGFQKEKLHQTNIEKYFLKEHVHIFPEKLKVIKEIFEQYKGDSQLFLIDDKLAILPPIKKDYPSVYTVWIKRGEYALSQKPIPGFSPDATIETLKDVVPLIASR